MARDYVEIQLDRPRRMKFKMRTIGEAEHFLPHKFVHYFMSPEARRALGSGAVAGSDLTEEDLRLVSGLADGSSNEEEVIGRIGREKFERIARSELGVFDFYGCSEILTMFWAGLIHEDPGLTQSKIEELIDRHVDAKSEFQRYACILRWVIQAAMLFFSGGEGKKAAAAPSAPTSGSIGIGAA